MLYTAINTGRVMSNRGNEIADRLARGASGLRFLGPELALGVSRCDM
jgi:hypothetical protein